MNASNRKRWDADVVFFVLCDLRDRVRAETELTELEREHLREFRISLGRPQSE